MNLYNTMGTLATVMDDVQLDLLFKKFEDSHSRPLPDTLRLFQLLHRLVASDSRVGPQSNAINLNYHVIVRVLILITSSMDTGTIKAFSIVDVVHQ